MKLEPWNLWDTLLKSHEKEPKSQRHTFNLMKHLKWASKWLEHNMVTKWKKTANFYERPDARHSGLSVTQAELFPLDLEDALILWLKKLINTWRFFAYGLKYANVRWVDYNHFIGRCKSTI